VDISLVHVAGNKNAVPPLRLKQNVRLMLVAFCWVALCSARPTMAQVYEKVHPAPDFGSGVVWLDQDARVPHHISDYRGRVVLIDFWEYTCINCIRDFGVIKRWYRKYHPYGFEVIGVHFGEFNIGFEVKNVRAAAQRFQLPWPIVADQNGTTWKAYESQGWPNRYLIDPRGQIVMQVFGEGNNSAMEAKLRELLAVEHPEVAKIALDPDENEFKPECGGTTQETFLGELYGRSAVEDLAGHHEGDVADFLPPHSPPDGGVMLVGRWRVEKDGVSAEGHGAAAEVRYHARSLYAVLSSESGKAVRVNFFQDGSSLPKESAGSDVKFDAKGAYAEVGEARMYYLVRSPALSAHLFSMQSESSGFTLHSFTYGNNCQLEDNPSTESTK
jgi:thiol-disulfide isomerase/thioredoxin